MPPGLPGNFKCLFLHWTVWFRKDWGQNWCRYTNFVRICQAGKVHILIAGVCLLQLCLLNSIKECPCCCGLKCCESTCPSRLPTRNASYSNASFNTCSTEFGFPCKTVHSKSGSLSVSMKQSFDNCSRIFAVAEG